MMKQIAIGRKGFLNSDDESIYFECYGAGETILLCHGKGGNHAIWFNQVPSLAQHYHVVVWDQRGFGRSTDRTEQAGPLTTITDIINLLDHLGIERAHLVGQSMGGWAVLGTALHHPDRVSSLVLADTIAGIYTPSIEASYDAYRARRAQVPPATHLAMDGHAVISAHSAEQNLTRAFLYQQIASLAAPPPAAVSQRLRATRFDLAKLNALQTPTLFIVGSEDSIFTPNMIREAAEQLPNAQVVEIPEADHSPYFATPDAWNNAVLTFLRS